VLAIGYLSLIPHTMEIRTPLPPGVEHFVGYAGTAGLLAIEYSTASLAIIFGPLSAYSAILELLQHFSPGRHPDLAGALWSSAGAFVGVAVVRLLWIRMGRRMNGGSSAELKTRPTDALVEGEKRAR